MSHLKYDRTEISSNAQHILENNHKLVIINLTLVKNVNASRQLDPFDSIKISKLIMQ